MQRRHPPRPIRPGGYVRYEIAPLPYGRLPLQGQPPVRAGERVVILHFDNPTVVDLASSAVLSAPSPSWRMLRDGRKEFAALAALAREGEFPPDVRAVWGETVFAPGIARLGLATRPAPASVRTTFIRLFLLGLIAIYGDGDPRRQARRLDHMRLGEVWMGLDELQQRFGTPASGRDGASDAAGAEREAGTAL